MWAELLIVLAERQNVMPYKVNESPTNNKHCSREIGDGARRTQLLHHIMVAA
jgi:hypothetical protein